MTSWRKLLTPQLQKLISRDRSSSDSSFSNSGNDLQQSRKSPSNDNNLFIESHSRNELTPSKSSNCNQKIQALKSQMVRLKEEMSQYSKGPSNLQSPFESVKSNKSNNENDKLQAVGSVYSHPRSREISEIHKTQKIGEKLIYDHDGTTVQRKKRVGSGNRDKMDNLRQSKERSNKENAKLDDFDEEESRDDVQSQRISILDSQTDLRSYVMKLNAELQAEKRRRKSIYEDMHQSVLEKQSLKQNLDECRQEISELKEIILLSRKDLEEMAMRLDTERHNSHQLSQKIKEYTDTDMPQKKLGTVRSHREHPYSDLGREQNSPHSQFNLIQAGKSARSKQTESSSAKKIIDWHSTSHRNERQLFHPVIKEFTARDAMDRSTHSQQSGLRASQKMKNNQSIQCDLQLEALVDHDEELHNHIQELKEQIIQRDYEIQSLKENKVTLISAFQEIIKLLTTENTTPKKQEHSIKQVNMFIDGFCKKAEEISRLAHNSARQRDLGFVEQNSNSQEDHTFQVSPLGESEQSSAFFRSKGVSSNQKKSRTHNTSLKESVSSYK